MLKFGHRDAVRTKIFTSDNLMFNAYAGGGRSGELRGYELVAIVEDEMQIDVPDDSPEAKERARYGGLQTKKVLTRRSLFVFEQNESAALDEAESARVNAESRAHELTILNVELGRKLREEIEPVKKQLESMVGEHEQLKQRNAELRANVNSERDLRRRLEDDLATVRRAVGDIRWKEILNSEGNGS